MKGNNLFFQMPKWVLSMDALSSRMQEHRVVKLKALQTFVKNLDAPCCESLKLGFFLREWPLTAIDALPGTPRLSTHFVQLRIPG